jgi:5-methylcytosine-specific restriction protein A
MKSFLITLKPQTESPERGWPLEELQRSVRRFKAGKRVEENWRFINRKDVSVGARVFLLVQGKLGPAIIGYGRVVVASENNAGKWEVRGHFESIVDPTIEVLATKEELFGIKHGQRFWRIQSSGVLLPENIASELEHIVVGKSPKRTSDAQVSNPDWTRDELILALNLYLKHRPKPPGKESEEIVELSRTLNLLGEKLFAPQDRADTFRNANGLYMKLMNFRRLDPQYTSDGRKGLSRGAKAEEEVWTEFGQDGPRCEHVANAIIASLNDPEVVAVWVEPDLDDGIQEAAEGRLLTRKHFARERNRPLVHSKRKQALKRNGKLICEVCDFDFAIQYGDRGNGFIECHHIKPVATLTQGQKTHINDLALVCANCHRIIHRSRPWLSVADLKALMVDAKQNIKECEPIKLRAQ